MTAVDKLRAAGCDEVVVFEERGYDDALIGITEDGRAVYDYMKMVTGLMEKEGWSEAETVEWIAYNTVGAMHNAGPKGPIIVYVL